MSKETKKVYSFLRDINDFERILLGHSLDLSATINDFIKRYKVPKDEFCKRLGISPRQYNDFRCGAFNYSLDHISKVEWWRIEKRKIEVEKEKIISIPEPKPIQK